VGRDPLAQLAEHLTFNQGVPRSSRGWITSLLARWSSGQDTALSRRDQGFDSPTGHHFRAISSAGRAPALQAGCRQFDPVIAHQNAAPWCSGLTCRPVTAEIDGSNPFGVAILYAAVAQSVEQRTENPRVDGSIPPCGTTKQPIRFTGWLFFCAQVLAGYYSTLNGDYKYIRRMK
jgi:hypothetical protein